ncbi:MAG: hypothetical protein Q9203_006881, partial [Teloschistes exilis]
MSDPPYDNTFPDDDFVYLLKLSPSNHGFSRVATARLDFSRPLYRYTDTLYPREDLGGWQIVYQPMPFSPPTFAVFFLFRQTGGESFILKWEVSRGIDPTIQIRVPEESENSEESKATDINFKAMDAYFGESTGSDRSRECLQHGRPVSGSVRKKLVDGTVIYVTEIQISPRPDTS